MRSKNELEDCPDFDITNFMIKYYTAIITISFIFISFPAQAEDKIFGLAMHGQAKYSDKDTHLAYVNANAPKGGGLKIAAIGTFDSLNPYSIKGIAAKNMNLVYDRLMRRVWDEPFTMYPLIAEHVEMAQDRSWIIFHINPKARFHDDTPITAQDVLFSYKTLKEHGRPNMRNIYKLVSKAEILDANIIKFSLSEDRTRETVMIIAMMPVLSQKWWGEREFNSTTIEMPLLNGAYRIKEFDIGRKITYERASDYWAKDLFVNKGQYNFDTVTYEYFRDDTIALEAFKKGDLNLRREWDVGKWNAAYNGMIKDNTQLNSPHQRPERAHGFIFNLRREPFNDINVRKALSLAFDYDWVAKNIFHGEFKRIESFFPNSSLKYPILHEKMDLSLRQKLKIASGILQDAGWIIENGKLVNKDTSKPFSFELMISTKQEEKIAITYQKTLQRLGIDMRIRMNDSATFQKRKSIYDYDMIAFFWQNSLSPGTEQALYWSCAAANEPSRFNYSGICNAELDNFVEKIADAKTYDDLTKYAHEIDRILLSQYISIPLFYKGLDYIAHHKNIKHSDIVPIYGAVIESWWMD